jgi:hypothetical protein
LEGAEVDHRPTDGQCSRNNCGEILYALAHGG